MRIKGAGDIPFTILSFVAQKTGITAEIVITFQDTSGAKTGRKEFFLNFQIHNFKSFLRYLFITLRVHDTVLKNK